jgi:hypothetical protein
MTQKEQAYQLVVDAINLATTKGAFNLQDVSNIISALQVLKPEEQPATQDPKLQPIKNAN